MGPPFCSPDLCTGSTTFCGAGREPSFDCRLQPRGNMNNPVCQGCRVGTENPLGATKMCTPCNTGYYAAANGTVTCVPCTNKPVGAVYTAWQAVASSNACPWVCGVGYRSDGSTGCVACEAGTFKASSIRVAEASKPRRGPHRPLKRGRKKHARLTPEQRRELLDRFARGEKGPALAREFGVADSYPYVMSRRRRPEPEALEEAAS